MQNNKLNIKNFPTDAWWKELERQAQLAKALNPHAPISVNDLPLLEELLNRYHTPHTSLKLKYKEQSIIFNKSLSPIKELTVIISSSETENLQSLHKLHSLTRSV